MTAIGSNVNSSQAVISLRSYVNPIGATQMNLLNYTTADNFTADVAQVYPATVAPSTSNASFNLATLFPTITAPVYFFVAEVTNPGIGFKFTTNSGANKFGVAANGFVAFTLDGSTALPTIYIDNPSSTQTLYLSMGALGI